jgi:endonuclease/exonuclease/phosphatase family metal-dependent hydrolase
MPMKIASFNVENLFSRSSAFLDSSGKKANPEVLATYGELTELLAESSYEGHEERILELFDKLGLKHVDENKVAVLRMERGHLLKRHKDDTVEVIAKGRGDWIGWVDLKRTMVSSKATENTASVIAEVRPDVIAMVEVEDRMTLTRFDKYVLKKVTGHENDPLRFAHVMLIDGNDERGIDVGVMARADFPLRKIRSHVDDEEDGLQIFSRDCAEYEVPTPDGGSLLLMVNHFKSKRGGSGDDKRERQAKRVAAIYNERRQEGVERIVVAGDLNDTPEGKPLQPLFAETDLKDAGDHDGFDWGTRKGTYQDGQRIDYLLLSPALSDAFAKGGIDRRGIWRPSEPDGMLPTLKAEEEAASDHAAIWVELNV